ncbi:Uncharacterised protein [Mycolicibacterium gilvum]|uniref:Uncharacterized protein n=2 Tax=Mycolicibacterium gilvum TaxID=1804 RepID=A0A378SQF9_9MYCO|nr:hypothetical protein Mflv_3485 [Mycolicibacterium gilvum PYR-GCK]MCV7058763.1 hypothetical protein [Mycolicibacterium gilvum]STZ43647.1 Uncharacterised protein [Mycolicibacterium gilvum]
MGSLNRATATRPAPPAPDPPRGSGTVVGLAAGVFAVILAVVLADSGHQIAVDQPASGQTRTVDIALDGMRVRPGALQVPAGTRLVLRVTNVDATPHDLRMAHRRRVHGVGLSECRRILPVRSAAISAVHIRQGDIVGNRANIVLVNESGWQLRYAHWAGCRMLDAILAGPEMAARYILAQETSDFWTDELFSDGGLLLDLVEHRLLFFGEELMTTMNERRAVFEMLKILWPGYSISWAYGATAELVEYVGAPVMLRDSPSEPELILAEDTDRLHHLVTVDNGIDRMRAWPLWWGSSAAWHGPQVLDRLPGVGARSLQLGTVPESGVHINVPDKTLGLWVTNPVPGLLRWLPRLWPSWRIEFWEDRYEEQFRQCGGLITAPPLDTESGVKEAQSWLKKRVYQSYEDSPMGRIDGLVALIDADGLPSPTVSDSAVRDAGIRPTPAEWALFESACAQVRTGGRAA